MAKLTKKAKSLSTLDADKLYGVDEALKTIKELATAKFDETIEVALNLGVDPRHADQMVRGMVSLPAGTGKEMKVAVFARADKAAAATAAGADKVGAEDLMEDMLAGNLDYDRVIATGHHPQRYRQEELLRRRSAQEFRRAGRCGYQEQAKRFEGQVPSQGRDQLVNGPWPEGQSGRRRWRLSHRITNR